MKRKMTIKTAWLSLMLILALALGCAAEEVREVGEIDLYNPTIYAGETPRKPDPGDGDALPVDVTWLEGEGAPEPVGEEAPAESGAQAPEGPRIRLTASDLELRMGLGERVALGGSVTGYLSDNPGVVQVDGKTGVATAVALGSARITATRKSDGTTVGCTVTVLNAPEAIAFDAAALTLGVGEPCVLAARLPDGAASARITYASSNKGVVTVDQSGRLRARKAGSAIIAAQAFNGVRASCKVKVRKAPSKVTLSAGKLILGKDETATLAAKLPSKSASAIAWRSKDEAVATVDALGVVRAVGVGTTTIRAMTFNGKKADCKVRVLDGATPTGLTLDAQAVTLGVGEKHAVVPALGYGEAALFAYSSSNRKIATVSKSGVITPRRPGEAVIAVATHNGLTAKLTVTVMKAPTAVGISQTELKLDVGKSARLTAELPEGCASGIIWESSDVSVATVDGEGYVTAVKVGTAHIRARTYNGLMSPLCGVIVTEAGQVGEETPIVITPPARRMGDNLRACEALGGKRNAIANVVELMVSDGFEPAFAAGVGGNIYSEGTYGLFESSKYIVNYLKRPRYFCYLDGGDYYTRSGSGYALTAVYMAPEDIDGYDGPAEARPRFDVENYYRDNFSGKYVHQINLDELEAFMVRLDKGGWEGKFGVGIVQWTGGRTKKLLARYRSQAGKGNATITPAQVAAAENEMILYDFKGDYKGVYNAWKDANPSALSSIAAARSAGALVCTKYEIPVDKEAKAVVRGEKAAEIFRIMMGL